MSAPGRTFRIHFLAVAAAVFAIGALRQPGIFIYPTFWAEDGTEFFRDSVELGHHALVKPIAGMHMALPRLIAWTTSVGPTRHAPFIYALAAGILSSLSLALFSRPGFRWLVPNDGARVALCLAFPLLSGMTESFFALCTLTYVLFVGVLFLLLEREEDGWRIGWGRVALVSFLWLSVGQAIVLAPVLLGLWALGRDGRYLVLFATLCTSVALNVASPNIFAPSQHPTLTELATVYGDNLLVRVLYLPLLGRLSLGPVLASPEGAFLGLSLLLIAVLGYLAARHNPIPAKDIGVLLLTVACALAVFPLTAVTRYYALPNLLRPGLVTGGRYDLVPSVIALVLWGAVLLPRGTGTRWRLAAVAALALFAINLRSRPLYEPPRPFRPFVWEWPGQSDRIDRALERRAAGRLRRTVVVNEIHCRPGPPVFGAVRQVAISP